MYSPDLQLKIQSWRSRAREGSLSIEETREIITTLRTARGAVTPATEGSAKAKATRAAGKKLDGDALLAELDD